MRIQHAWAWVMLMLLAAPLVARADDAVSSQADKPDDANKALYEKFTKQMSGVQLRGNFTITGKEDAGLKEETYIIKSVTKLPKDDYWLFQATVRYGKKDVTLPMPLQVKWAGSTPIITLDNVTLPGLGTFSSRVVIDEGKYAGTWTHDEVGGHLFGVIEPVKKEE